MNTSNILKLVLTVMLLGGAGWRFAHFLRQHDGVTEKTFFYPIVCTP
jgi:hypothetical protein